MSATRRTLLAGLALPALASGCPVLLAASPGHVPPHPDAALLALAATIPALAKRSLTLGREHDRIEAACFAEAGPEPEKPRCRPSAFPDFQDFDRAMDAWQAELRARDARLVAAGAALGINDAARAYAAAEDALLDACWAISEIRATTMAGLIAKARLAEAHHVPELRDSLLADLVAMGGRA